MDFNFRSMEGRSSNFHSSSSTLPNDNNVSDFAHQSVRAGFTNPDPIRREIHRNTNNRESLQRELEKERIRAEIIAEEVYRRKILEDEVRRELMYEREMALRHGGREFRFASPMRFQSRVPSLMNFEHPIGVSPHREVGFSGSQTMPFQRDPVVFKNVDGNGNGIGNGNGLSLGVKLEEIKEIKGSTCEGNKDNVIFLAKPNVSDLKRKATSPIVAPVDPSAGIKKPKTKEDFSCALCRVTTTSERGLNDHLQGKKHKARESGLNYQRTGFGIGPLPKTSSTSTEKPIKVPSISINPSFKKAKKGVAESSVGEVDNAPAQELLGTVQKGMLLQETVEKRKNGEATLSQQATVSAKLKKKFKYFCETCQVGAYALNVMNAHKNGKRHLANVMEVSKAGEVSALEGAVETKKENEEPDTNRSVEKGVVEEKKEGDVVIAKETRSDAEVELIV